MTNSRKPRKSPELINRKICFFNSTKIWGGGEKWHFEMALQLKKLNYDIVFVANRKSELARRLQKTIIPFKTFRIGNLSFLNMMKMVRLRRYFKKEKIIVIVMNLPSDIKAAGIAAKWAGVKRIIYRRGSAVPIKNSFINRYIFGKILTDVIANSKATKMTILERNKNLFLREKIRVIYNGIELPTAKNLPINRFYTPVNNEMVLGNLGRMVYQKGHEILLDVAHRLKDEGILFKLLLAGNGPLEQKIRAKANKLQLDDCILFLGFIDDIYSFMHSIDIFLLSSRWEGFGFVLAEAMAASKPIVAFDISSNPELVTHGINGFLASPFDTTEFANYLITLIKNQNLRDDFGKMGIKIVQEKFSFERVVREFIDVLNH